MRLRLLKDFYSWQSQKDNLGYPHGKHMCYWQVDHAAKNTTWARFLYYSDVIMNVMASQINGVYCLLIGCSGADQIKYQCSASLVFVRGNHHSPEDSPHKRPVTWKMFPFDSVIKICDCVNATKPICQAAGKVKLQKPCVLDGTHVLLITWSAWTHSTIY